MGRARTLARDLSHQRGRDYVGITRARDFLYVLWPQRYYLRPFGLSDRHTYAQCSRFFTDDVVETMEEVALSRK